MTFLSPSFYAFFAGILLMLWKIKKEKYRQLILLFASFVFYLMLSPRYLLMLIGMSVVFYMGGILIRRNKQKKKAYLAVFIIMCAGLLAYFKYYNFFARQVSVFLNRPYTEVSVLMPLGISYYMFQGISYLFDVYKGVIAPETSFVNIVLYIAFFPQMLSGPIVKAKDFMPQLYKDHSLKKENFIESLPLFLVGLFKKVVIADRIGAGVDVVFSSPSAYSSASLWIAVIGYSVQLYCDFSGYSDMAIAIGKMLGYDLGINFDIPYIANSPSDFWKRWHISLSSWLKEYVYIPLGGSRKGEIRAYVNLIITMFISGVWHGSKITFVIWGLAYGLWSCINRFFEKKIYNKSDEKIIVNVLRRIITIALVFLLWVPFRTESVRKTLVIYNRMFTPTNGIEYFPVFTIIYSLIVMALMIYMYIKSGHRIYFKMDIRTFKGKFEICLIVLLIAMFGYIGNGAFIYGNF